MDFGDMFIAQLTDPFRIGLVAALFLTSLRTAGTVGSLIPLALGVVFVAVLIPTSLASETPYKMSQIGIGIISNVVILAVFLALKVTYDRISGRKAPD
jgi:uncharacterized membrane protein